jgi:hypothetical protein
VIPGSEGSASEDFITEGVLSTSRTRRNRLKCSFEAYSLCMYAVRNGTELGSNENYH